LLVEARVKERERQRETVYRGEVTNCINTTSSRNFKGITCRTAGGYYKWCNKFLYTGRDIVRYDKIHKLTRHKELAHVKIFAFLQAQFRLHEAVFALLVTNVLG